MQNNPFNQQAATTPFVDQDALNESASQAATSHLGSGLGAGKRRLGQDDAQSTVSPYTSYTVQSDERMVRKEAGREFNMLNEIYPLPADEYDRLDRRHRAICLVLGGLYPAPEVVRAVLAPEEGVMKRVLDLGYGTGIWCTEMAREFPHCEVVGIDLAPAPLLPEEIPPNCRFEMDDINQGLDHLQGMYDVVHARAISLGLKDFRKSLQQIVGCAKPGGVVICIEASYNFHSGLAMKPVSYWSATNPQGSYTQRVVYEFRRSAMSTGSDVMAAEKDLDEGFWNNAPMLDPDTCKAGSIYLPTGTWCKQGDPAQQEQLRYIGMLMRQNFIEVSRVSQPSIMKTWSKQACDKWTEGMRDECQNDTLISRIQLAWGRRRAGPNLPAPVLHEVPIDEEGRIKYPLYDIYNTVEEAAAAAETRNRDRNVPALPWPWDSTE